MSEERIEEKEEKEVVEQGVHNYSQEEDYVWPTDPKVLQKLEWFKDQKLALMMHWGAYSQLGIVESWALSDADAEWSRGGIDWNVSAEEFKKQFKITNGSGNILDIINKSYINCGDARRINWIESNSIDLVITSPPYLCAQDYIKTMRLINLFFPDERFRDLPNKEIGPRSRRRGKAVEVVQNFYNDMDDVLSEIRRVLKKDKYFCLVIGQGKGKITEGYDTVKDIDNLAIKKHNFEKVYQKTRNINYKVVRVGGVDREEILIFRKIN